MSTEPTAGPEPIMNPEAIPAAQPLAPDGTPAPDPAPAPDPTATAESAAVADSAAAVIDGAAAAVAVPAADAVGPVVSKRRLERARLATRRALRFAIGVGLLVLGIAIGWDIYLLNRPLPVVVGDPAVVGQPAPAIVEELANAISADDADAIRSALPQEMFARYTSEMQRFGIARIDAVETLGTYTDGPRTATGLMLLGTTVDSNPFAINLVVVTENGMIVRLR